MSTSMFTFLFMIVSFVMLIFFGFFTAALALLITVCGIRHKEITIFLKCLPREIHFLWCISKMVLKVKKDDGKTLGELLSKMVRRHPNKLAIVDAESERGITFQEVENLSNKISNIFKEASYEKGDSVALFMDNQIEYIPIYIGLSNIGVSTAFINPCLKGDSLRRALNIKNFKAIIYKSDPENDILIQKYNASSKTRQLFTFGGRTNTSALQMEELIETAPSNSPKIDYTINSDFPVSYIFTSGTTGQPKAAVMARKKFISGFSIFRYLTDIHQDDVIYNTLPMCHTSGSVIFAAGLFLCGCTMVIRPKFSASNYIKDCIKYNVTYAGYIGEMMRYLLALPPNELDQKHKVRKIVGNGLRKSLVKKLKNRYNFQQIYEFYGATEANFGFINTDNTEGAVGFLFKCFKFLNMKRLVKIERVTGELIRQPNGAPIECKPGEEGTLISLINKAQPYYGYIDKKASDKKVLKDVYVKGDSYFMSGDLLVTDEFGYLYFVDRLGDTFRWKGENVSTTEVENIISGSFHTYIHCIVYPVKIPKHEGSAGMLYVNEKVSIEEINEALLTWKQHLPTYALPLSVRIGDSLSLTSTFKYQKEELKRQGMDLKYCKENEEILVLKHNQLSYGIMDIELYNNIMNGERQF